MSDLPQRQWLAIWPDNSFSIVWAPTWRALATKLGEEGDPLDVAQLVRLKPGDEIITYKEGHHPVRVIKGGTLITREEMEEKLSPIGSRPRPPAPSSAPQPVEHLQQPALPAQR